MRLKLAADQPWHAHARTFNCRDAIYSGKNCPRLLQPRANNLGVCTEPVGRCVSVRVRAQGCRRPLHFQHSRSTSCSFALSSSSLDFSVSDSVFRWARVSFSCTSCVAISGNWGDFIYFLYAGGGRRRKGLKAELTADAAVMTSRGEDAPPVYGRGGGCCCCCPRCTGSPFRWARDMAQVCAWGIQMRNIWRECSCRTATNHPSLWFLLQHCQTVRLKNE